jgi:hypothetical protein
MAAKKVDIMEIRQLLFVKEKGESNPSYEKFLSIYRNTINHYVRLFKAKKKKYLDGLEKKRLEQLKSGKSVFGKNGVFSSLCRVL